jgi:hypothetical protein
MNDTYCTDKERETETDRQTELVLHFCLTRLYQQKEKTREAQFDSRAFTVFH